MRLNKNCKLALYEIVAHHPHVFMFQIVAMVKEHPRVIVKVDQDFDTLTGHYQNRIFPALIHIALMGDAAALKHSELFAMQVDRVGHVHHVHHPPTGVMKLPYFP
jgi:hypothetical protein